MMKSPPYRGPTGRRSIGAGMRGPRCVASGDQHEPPGRVRGTRFGSAEVDAGPRLAARARVAIPRRLVAPGGTPPVFERPHHPAGQIEDADADPGCMRYDVLQSGRALEWIGAERHQGEGGG